MRLQRRWQLASVLFVVSVLGVVFIFWNVLHAGISHAAPEMQYDTAGSIWTNAWIAHAIAHFQNPFFSPNLMHPYGLNLLANVYNVAFSTIFAPITWLFNPIVSTNLQLMMDPVVDAVVMGLCLRRVARSPWLAVVGGIAWGFCPFVITSLAKGWTNVGFLAAPPIIAWLLCELADEHGWSSRRIGITLAVTVVVQYFVDSELLVITAAGAVVAVAVLAIQERERVRACVHRWVSALEWAAGVCVVVLIGPVAYGAVGPHPDPSWVRPESTFESFVSPLHGVLLTSRNPTLPPNLRFSLTANPQFLGLGVAVVILVGLILFRFPRNLRPVVAAGLVCLWISVGYGPSWSPYPLIARIPVLHNITVTRFIILTWFAAIIVVVDVAGRAFEWCRAHVRWPAVAAIAAAAAILVAFTPPLEAVAQNAPISASSTTGDNALPVILAQPGKHVILGFPFPVSVRQMLQQAVESNFNFDLAGGDWPQIFDSPEPATSVNLYMLHASEGVLTSAPSLVEIRELQLWLGRWGVTNVIVPRSYVPDYAAVYGSPQQFATVITEALGPPRLIAGEWTWEISEPVPFSNSVITNAAWLRCASPLTTPIDHAPTCVANAPHAPSSV
jgi:hypothetical protein